MKTHVPQTPSRNATKWPQTPGCTSKGRLTTNDAVSLAAVFGYCSSLGPVPCAPMPTRMIHSLRYCYTCFLISREPSVPLNMHFASGRAASATCTSQIDHVSCGDKETLPPEASAIFRTCSAAFRGHSLQSLLLQALPRKKFGANASASRGNARSHNLMAKIVAKQRLYSMI